LSGGGSIIEYAVVDRIIDHLGLTFVTDNPPPSREDFSPAPDILAKSQKFQLSYLHSPLISTNGKAVTFSSNR